MKWMLLLSVLLSLSACAGSRDISALRKAMDPVSLLDGAAPVVADHHFTFTRDGQAHSFLTHLEIKPDRLSFIGLGALGEVMFECTYVNEKAQCSALSDQLPAMMLMKEVQLIYWPLDLVRAQMKSDGFTALEQGQKRTICYHGEVFSEISYRENSKLSSEVTLDNKRYHYQIHIRPLHIEGQTEEADG